jgi:ABC-type Zn uptake system ZnuABC Zn-binding protein ZnuA/ABC-type Mn2+/Zn2+ transport system permease subunit
MPAPFDQPYLQRALVEITLLAVVAGVLGTWIVLRQMSFFAHAVGTAAFPGLVLADGLAFPALIGAFGMAAVVAIAVSVIAGGRDERRDSATALMLVGAIAAGVILASDVFHSQGSVDQLLFGSLLVVGPADLRFGAAVAVLAVLAAAMARRSWLLHGFDPPSARSLGGRSRLPDLLLLAVIAAAAVATLSTIGALLATAVLVVPAATARLLVNRMRGWSIVTAGLALAEGVFGLWLSVRVNAPPGATIAVVSTAVFGAVSAVRWLRTRSRAAASALLAAAALVIAGCGSSDPGGGGPAQRLPVVATTTQLADIARQVGGPAVDVHQILQPNTDPHTYEPRPADVEATGGAKLVLLSGDGLDTWMRDVIRSAGGGPVLDAGAGRPVTLPGEQNGPEASRFDPHWWHDPRNVEYAAQRIRDALIKADPAARRAITASTSRYLAQLRRLDAGIVACMAGVPADQRRLVTDHDAFGYFAKRYGIQVVGAVIPSQSTQAQPSARDLAALVGTIRRQKVRAVFPESSINPKLADVIARETGASADHTLYGDTLGPRGSAGGTYLGMEQTNADQMVRGFTGAARGCSIKGL